MGLKIGLAFTVRFASELDDGIDTLEQPTTKHAKAAVRTHFNASLFDGRINPTLS